jgi:anti-sigma28 factor (negative regulator of flagellin synthesis)
MKRKAHSPGKKESAAIPAAESSNPAVPERRAEKRIENSDQNEDKKITELRQKIRSGFYNNKEVLDKIVENMLNDIHSGKSDK